MKKFLVTTLTMLCNIMADICMIIGYIVLIIMISFVDTKSTIVITNDPHMRSDIEHSLQVNKSRIASNKDITMLHLKLGE